MHKSRSSRSGGGLKPGERLQQAALDCFTAADRQGESAPGHASWPARCGTVRRSVSSLSKTHNVACCSVVFRRLGEVTICSSRVRLWANRPANRYSWFPTNVRTGTYPIWHCDFSSPKTPSCNPRPPSQVLDALGVRTGQHPAERDRIRKPLQAEYTFDQGVVLVVATVAQFAVSQQDVDHQLPKEGRLPEDLPAGQMPKTATQLGLDADQGKELLEYDQPGEGREGLVSNLSFGMRWALRVMSARLCFMGWTSLVCCVFLSRASYPKRFIFQVRRITYLSLRCRIRRFQDFTGGALWQPPRPNANLFEFQSLSGKTSE